MASGIKLNLKGFEKMLEDLEQAGGNVDAVAKRAVKESAAIVERELKAACDSARIPPSISDEITTELEVSANRYSARVGWKLGTYDPSNPSAGFKAIFLNYGTGRRHTSSGNQHVPVAGEWRTLGSFRGQISPRGFIARAKASARPKCRKVQREIIQEALEALK